MIYYFQNAPPSSREPMKINEQQLDLYIERIIEAAASSLGDVVVRVSSSTKQLERDFGNRSVSSLNVFGILTSSYSKVTPSQSLTAVCEPEGGSPVHAPSQEGNYCCFMSMIYCNKFSHGCHQPFVIQVDYYPNLYLLIQDSSLFVLMQSLSLGEGLQFQLRNMRPPQQLMPPVKKVITAV